MSDDELAWAGPGALARRVRAGELSPRELVEFFLARIEALNPSLNAIRVTLADEALAAADALERAGITGPLAGVPVAIKDDLAVAGQRRTLGSKSFGPPEAADAIAVARLRAAGAIPVAITNVPELTLWPWTATDANGITRNPWDLERSPGGSSGGAGAAVAAAMVPAATGSDGAGSIRIPAACCGLVGMKPTRGLVTMGPAGDAWYGLTVLGALARTVADSALLLDVMADTGTRFQEAASRPPGRLRIAISRKVPPGVIAFLARDQRLAWDRTARLLGELGHDVGERDPAYGLVALDITQTYLRAIHEAHVELPEPALAERASRQMSSAGRVLVPAWRRDALLAKRATTTARVLSLWDDYDVLLTPCVSRTALAAEGAYGRSALRAFDLAARFVPWLPLFNLTGQPAIAIPAGFASDDLPLSVQLVGRPGAEETLYALAAQLEEARPWAPWRPPGSVV
jgi:amidase